MYIFAGSYERFIFGYSASSDCSEPQDVVKRYTFAAHKSAVKCLIAGGPYVASGGADDLIHLYDMKAERDLGVLMNPCDGAVPCLEFYTPEGRSVPSHMFSGSADGGINIWRCKDWEHLKVLRGHKGAVNSIAVHPSGKLALSTARDRGIRIWNLIKGRVMYSTVLEAEAEQVAFLASGENYLLTAGNRITVHSACGEGALLAAYTAPRRILCSVCQDDQLLLLGLEDGSVRLWDVRSSTVVGGWERAHSSRVRSMAIMQRGSGKLPASLVTASTDGTIKLWDTRMLGSSGGAAEGPCGGARCTAQVSTGARLTCLAAVDPEAPAPVLTKTASNVAALRVAAGDQAAAQVAMDGSGRKERTVKKAAGGVAEQKKAGAKNKAAAEQPQQQQPLPKPRPQQYQPTSQREEGRAAQPQAKRPQPKPPAARPERTARGRQDDDPGFEIVPATTYDSDPGLTGGGGDSGSGSDDDGDDTSRRGSNRGAEGKAVGRGRGGAGKHGRRARVDKGDDEEEGGAGRGGGGGGEEPGTSGRGLTHGGARGPKATGKRPLEGAERRQQQQQQQQQDEGRPGKKTKVTGRGGGGGGGLKRGGAGGREGARAAGQGGAGRADRRQQQQKQQRPHKKAK